MFMMRRPFSFQREPEWPERGVTLSRSRALWRGQTLAGFGGRVVGLRVGGEAPFANVLAILRNGARDFGGKVRVLAHEFGLVAGRETDQIVEHKDLAVAVGPSANADRGDAELCGDARGKLARQGL